jgi:hypothetical protein
MNYIYEAESLPKSICDKIINYFENNTEYQYEGLTHKGLDQNIKTATNMLIPENDDINNTNIYWKEISKILDDELTKHLKIYNIKINDKPNFSSKNNYGKIFEHLPQTLTRFQPYMIQSYEPSKGRYVYHSDDAINLKLLAKRELTYIWYLNDVEDGGETEFFGDNKTKIIKPKCGKLCLFPAHWTFPHRAKIAFSSKKHIVTGWLYDNITNTGSTKTICTIIPLLSNETDNLTQQDLNKKTDDLIFDHIYYTQKCFLYDYKRYITTNKTYIEDFKSENVFSEISCIWTIKNMFEKTQLLRWNRDEDTNNLYIELEYVKNIFLYFITSFSIISDIIKHKYNLVDINLDINGSYICKYDNNNNNKFISNFKEKKYDLVVQIIISKYNESTNDSIVNRDVYINKKIKFYPNSQYEILFFINFSYLYKNNDLDQISILIKDIVEKNFDKIILPDS